MNTVGELDVIQYLKPSRFKDVLIPYSFAQIMGFVDEYSGVDSRTLHCVILPLGLKGYSSLSDAWRTRQHDDQREALRDYQNDSTIVDIPSQYTKEDLRVLEMTQSVRRVATQHCCTPSCRGDNLARPAHSGSLESGGTFTVLQRHHGYPPHCG